MPTASDGYDITPLDNRCVSAHPVDAEGGVIFLGCLPVCAYHINLIIICTIFTIITSREVEVHIIHAHTHLFNGPFSGTTQVSRYKKGKTSLDFTGARDSEWQWHQQGCMQVCTSLQTDNHASTPPLSFLQAGCPSCHPTNSVKALKANSCSCTTYYLLIVPKADTYCTIPWKVKGLFDLDVVVRRNT